MIKCYHNNNDELQKDLHKLAEMGIVVEYKIKESDELQYALWNMQHIIPYNAEIITDNTPKLRKKYR